MVDGSATINAQPKGLFISDKPEGNVKLSFHEKVYRAAEGNWRAAEVLRAYLDKGEYYVIDSYGMIVGLAIELYLKVILYIEGRGHDFKGKKRKKPKSWVKLYGMLSQESRVAIKNYFNVTAPKYPPLTLSESIPEEVRALAKDKVITCDFDGTLRIMSEAFADFRYAFEHPYLLVCVPTASTMRDAIRKRILDLAPNLGKQ